MQPTLRWPHHLVILTLCLTLWLGGIAHASTVPSHGETQGAFQTLVQPLSIRIAVTVGTLGLAALELWWFLGHRTVPTLPRDQTSRPPTPSKPTIHPSPRSL